MVVPIGKVNLYELQGLLCNVKLFLWSACMLAPKHVCMISYTLSKFHRYLLVIMMSPRDGNSGTGTRPNGYGYGDDFLPTGDTRTRPELRQVRDGYFFPPTGNPMGTRYFSTAIILGCK
jgi:hypothetical protein